MKIAEVKIHKVIVPMRPSTVHSPGVDDKLCAPDPFTGRSLNFDEFPKWIIELVADNGLIGLGEPRRGDLYQPLKQGCSLHFTHFLTRVGPQVRVRVVLLGVTT